MKKKSLFAPFLLAGLLISAQTPQSIPLEKYFQQGTHRNTSMFSRAQNQGLQIQEFELQPDTYTDALFSFNSDFQDYTGHYELRGSDARIASEFAKSGPGSLVFPRHGGLIMDAKPGSMFFPGTLWEDFTIEFWMYPANLEDGEIVFLWQGGSQLLRELSDSPMPGNAVFENQEIRVQIEGRQLVWYFQDFFLHSGDPGHIVKVHGSKPLIPRTWSHHRVLYDASTGRMEYQVNHIPASITPVTQSGDYDSAPLKGFVGESSRNFLELAPRFIGFLDELRISRSLREELPSGQYLGMGEWESPVIDLGYSNSRLASLEYGSMVPDGTDYLVEFRSADEILRNWQPGNRIQEEIPGSWKTLGREGQFPGNARGRYVQLRVKLWGTATGDKTPSLENLSLNFYPDTPPSPPHALRVLEEDRALTLIWTPVLQQDIAGYRIFYGNHPDQMDQMITLPAGQTQYTLSNLEEDKIYYLTVVSFDQAQPPHQSQQSQIIAARPQRYYSESEF